MSKISECADVYSIDEFKDCCEHGYFIDYDGVGFYANAETGEESDIQANPSAFCDGNIRTDFTHVAWYNK